MNKQKARKILRDAEKTSIQIDDSLEIAIGPNAVAEVTAKAEKALKKGKTVRWSNGLTQWIKHVPIVNKDRNGSEKFVWDKSGNKIKHQTVLFSKKKNSQITQKVIGSSYRLF